MEPFLRPTLLTETRPLSQQNPIWDLSARLGKSTELTKDSPHFSSTSQRLRIPSPLSWPKGGGGGGGTRKTSLLCSWEGKKDAGFLLSWGRDALLEPLLPHLLLGDGLLLLLGEVLLGIHVEGVVPHKEDQQQPHDDHEHYHRRVQTLRCLLPYHISLIINGHEVRQPPQSEPKARKE